jgi:hypothetical protein
MAPNIRPLITVASIVALFGVGFTYRHAFVHDGAEERRLDAEQRAAEFRQKFAEQTPGVTIKPSLSSIPPRA